MKKILATIFALSVISTAAFARNFFSQRFFEIKTGAELGVSNNLFAANEFMKKDLVIDLRKIADDCPENGFNLRADVEPMLALNLNIKDFHLGVSSGLDVYESMSVGKDLFDFLGYGNELGETLDFTFNNDTDVFAYSNINVGFKLGKLKIKVQPTLFLPIISVRGGGGKATVVNDTNGNLIVDVDLNMDVYSIVPMKSEDKKSISFETDKITAALQSGYGFDLGGGVAYNLTKSFFVEATCRIPVFPGYLDNKSNINGGFDYKVKLTEFDKSEKENKDVTVTNSSEKISLHRPLKFDLYADKSILGSLFNARAGAGFGIRRPFSEYAVFYPEYYLGFTINLIDIFKVGVSTQYRDQVFIHQLGTTLNIRIFQIDLGLSSQSTSFTKSMSVAGIGGYAYVSVGF